MPRERIESTSFFIGRQGKGVISFGSGQPDLPPPMSVFTVLRNSKTFRYGLIQGDEALRKGLAKHHPGFDPDDFVITNGSSEALDLGLRVLGMRHPGKKVLLTKPYYYSYPHIIRLAGLTPVFTNLTSDGRIDLEDFRRKLSGAVAALINSPSNPTGRVEPPATLQAIERMTKGSGAILFSDEVYRDLIYTGADHYSPRGKHVVTLDSFSKTFAMCGLRVGYLYTKNTELIRDIVEMKVHTSMNTNSLGQSMALAALAAPQKYFSDLRRTWQKRRDVITSGLRDLGFDLWEPEGAFYVLPKVKGDSNKIVNDLFYDHRVIAYDGAWFGAPGRIRLSYALNIPEIKEGLKRIGKYLRGQKSKVKGQK